MSLNGWQRALMLVALGGLMGWGHAPLNWWPVSLLAFPLFLHLLEGARGWSAFGRSFLFSFGYFLFGIYWIAEALFVDIHQFWWALPFAVAGLPLVLALFHAAAGWATQRFGGTGFPRAVFFAAAWSAAELVRGHVLTGFPWLLTGYVWVDVAPVRLMAASIGIYGVSFWAVLLASCVPLHRDRLPCVVTFLLLAALPFALPQPATAESPETLSLRIVQPNMAQNVKLDPVARERDFSRVLDLTAVTGPAIALVIWPETAVPFRLEERAAIRQLIASYLPTGAMLLTGAVRREGANYFNSIIALDRQGEIIGSYDKSHLVPFGEYIPFHRYLPFDPVAGGVDFSSGPGPQTLSLSGLPAFSPLICYEVLFPGDVVNQDNRPRLMINVTNDGWYGLTHGPYQHLAVARLRAVEEGLPLVRAANTGISAVVDAKGQVLAQLPLGVTGVLDFNLPLTGMEKPIYPRLGDFPLIAVLAVMLGGLPLTVRKSLRS